MTKRFGNFPENDVKKLKPNYALEDLWGDDFDSKDIEDCFLLATQTKEQDNLICNQRNNVSILPPYNVFKQTSKRIFTSTQSDPELNSSSIRTPSTSKVSDTNGNVKNVAIVPENGFKRTHSFEPSQQYSNLHSKIKVLQETLYAKEGEVSILRTQLKQIKTNNENEFKNKQKDWSEKLQTVTKQLNAVKSELEFKNLEVVNFKQKIAEIKKYNNLDSTINLTQPSSFKQPQVTKRSRNTSTSNSSCETVKKTPYKNEFKVQPIKEIKYPIQSSIPTSLFFSSQDDKYLMDFKSNRMCRNTIPFLQNQMSEQLVETLIQLQSKWTLLDNKKQLNFDYCYLECFQLMKCNMQEINSEKTLVYINKVLCISEQFLYNLNQFLQEHTNTELENSQKINSMGFENKLQQFDLGHSHFNSKKWCPNEMGINARLSVTFISELLPYSSYLRGYLLHNKKLIFEENSFLNILTSATSKTEENYSNNFDYIKLILSIVSCIGKFKKPQHFCGLLSAIAILLNKICLSIKIEEINHILVDLTREFIFCVPSIQILLHFTEFLTNATLQKIYVNELCKMPENTVFQINQKEKILYYNRDTCMVRILCVVLEESLNVDHAKSLMLYSNIIKFISNCMKCSPRWLFFQEDKHCNCVSKIVKLCVDVIYRTIDKFHKKSTNILTNELSTYSEILNTGLKVLHNFYCKMYYLVVQYITTSSQSRDIFKLILQHKSALRLNEPLVRLLEGLNITEEIPIIEAKTFEDMFLWNAKKQST